MMYTPRTAVAPSQQRPGEATPVGWYRIQRVPFSQLMEDCRDMFERHWREVAAHPDVPLRIDVQGYLDLDAKGRLLALMATDQQGKPVGYTVFVTAYHGHYCDTLHAMNDVIYVDPGSRGARLGLKMIREAEGLLKEMGVRVIRYHVKTYLDWSRMLEHEGYMFTDKILDKVI